MRAAGRKTVELGYGADHKRERARWRPLVEAGVVNCAKCGWPIRHDPTKVGGGWHLGHDETRLAYTGPEHDKCNWADGGRRGIAVIKTRRRMVRRNW